MQFFCEYYSLINNNIAIYKRKNKRRKKSEDCITDDVKKYLKVIKEFNNENIMEICWKSKKLNKNLDENAVLFVIGNKQFIENEVLEDVDCEIIKCYKVENIQTIKNIADKFEYYLRTDGKLKIIKNSLNEQTSNTVISHL